MYLADPKPAGGSIYQRHKVATNGQPLMAILDPNPPEFPSRWANSYGQDRFGLWQGLALSGVRQIMRWIPPGSFMMGSPEEGKGRLDDETLHQVTLTQGFWLAETACTQALWQAVMAENPSAEPSPEHPVNHISWKDCQQFIAKANAELDGRLTLRLPTEAQWEYAARAGSQCAYWWGDSITGEQANFNEDRDGIVDVLQYDANDFGLFQVHGNVWEWCQDWYGEYSERSVENPLGAGGHDRVLRGGSYWGDPHELRAACRLHCAPGNRDHFIGLRLAGG